MKILFRYILIAAVLVLAGCAHKIAFEDVNYTIAEPKRNAGVIAVIDQATLDKEVTIKSFSTGIIHDWNAQPGRMLKQVADIELPQMFEQYSFATAYQKPGQTRDYVIVMTIPSYDFSDFRARATLNFKVYAGNGKLLLDKNYTAEGPTQGSKMVLAGAFGMQSAIRQSSIEAYKTIFSMMRADLQNVLSRTA